MVTSCELLVTVFNSKLTFSVHSHDIDNWMHNYDNLDSEVHMEKERYDIAQTDCAVYDIFTVLEFILVIMSTVR